ncbi:serine protease snake-like isoform X2 [Sitophilus oryzae]|uniref:Serine protease snake-like isoform X2 n=1 Tax=Sitophilus oryzae TaxID=7048 RepID=A0A6J2Y4N1_SITOR|nr:serine protease snake-like isoform X2 [Sitophilus oryzae]
MKIRHIFLFIFVSRVSVAQKNTMKRSPKVPLVVGGVRTKQGEFQHMVALGYGERNDPMFLCGGSLISPQFILTAAHCADTLEGSVQVVRINTITLETPFRKYMDIDVQKTIIHPKYKPQSNYNDIALLKLSKNVPSFIKPASLHNTSTISRKILTAIGWGRTDFAGPSSNDLLKVNLEVYSKARCNPFYKNVNKLSRGIDNKIQICAGGQRNETKDTCQGDSGGPLSYKKGQKHHLVGITSFGKACGLARVPAVYTRVSAYVPWIKSIVWKKKS